MIYQVFWRNGVNPRTPMRNAIQEQQSYQRKPMYSSPAWDETQAAGLVLRIRKEKVIRSATVVAWGDSAPWPYLAGDVKTVRTNVHWPGSHSCRASESRSLRKPTATCVFSEVPTAPQLSTQLEHAPKRGLAATTFDVTVGVTRLRVVLLC